MAVSGGAATPAVVTPVAVASEQAMAERYQPSYDQGTYRAVPRHFFPVRSDEALPSGTKFSLVDSGDNDYISQGAVMVAMRSDNGELQVWFNSLRTPNPGVSTVPVRVAAYYPDGSSEIFVSNVSVTPEDTHAYDIHYPGVEVTAGTVASADPSTNHRGYPVPAGTTFAMTGYQEVHDRRAEGWIIEVDSISGELTVAAPEGRKDLSQSRFLSPTRMARATPRGLRSPPPRPPSTSDQKVTIGGLRLRSLPIPTPLAFRKLVAAPSDLANFPAA